MVPTTLYTLPLSLPRPKFWIGDRVLVNDDYCPATGLIVGLMWDSQGFWQYSLYYDPGYKDAWGLMPSEDALSPLPPVPFPTSFPELQEV